MEEIAVPAIFKGFRRFALDGALLLFDRDTGTNALCEGEETAHLHQRAPRVVQFGLTNRCNLTCGFCSRDLEAASTWTADDAFTFLRDLADAGLLEVAFGGGEPLLFPQFDALVRRLYEETPLAISFTTNGTALTPQRLARLRGSYGQIRLSLYDDNDWRTRVEFLASENARFGVNLLVSPSRLDSLETTVLELVSRGCRDVLLLSYNGHDRAMHLSAAEQRILAERVQRLSRGLAGRCTLKLDVCWGPEMASVPRLFSKSDCGAGREFLVVTSDRKVMPCSFHDLALPVRSAREALEIWRDRQDELRRASVIPGCARPGAALVSLGRAS